jgi:hypothetical protein
LKENELAASEEKPVVWHHNCKERNGEDYYTWLDTCGICGEKRLATEIPKKETDPDVLAFCDVSPKPASLPGWTLVPIGMAPKVISMCMHKEILIVATENGVYRLEGDVLKPLKFEVEP